MGTFAGEEPFSDFRARTSIRFSLYIYCTHVRQEVKLLTSIDGLFLAKQEQGPPIKSKAIARKISPSLLSADACRPGLGSDARDEVLDADGREGHQLQGAPRPKLHGYPGDRLVVGRLDDVPEVAGAEDTVLRHQLAHHPFDLLVDLPDALGAAPDRLAALVGEVGQQHVGCHRTT